MRRKGDLERLTELRTLRLDRAVLALAEQSAAIAAADARLAAATAAAVANADRREAREGQLFDRLAMRPLTTHEIGRAHDALTSLEREADALDSAEQEAVRALEDERERRRDLAAERLRLQRARDKLEAVALARAVAERGRAELMAELDADGDGRPGVGHLPAARRPVRS